MSASRHIWEYWANALHRWGVSDAAAVVLEALGPLTLIGAQIIYLSQPVLKPFALQGHLEALAEMLEDGSQTSAFVTYLREAR